MENEKKYQELKEAVVKMREAQNALLKCQDRTFIRQLAIDAKKEQDIVDVLIGLKTKNKPNH